MRRGGLPFSIAAMLVLASCSAETPTTGTSPATTEAAGETTDSTAAATDEGSTEPVTVRFNLGSVASTVPLWAAIDMGFFEEEGVIAETENITSGADALNAVLGGSLDASIGPVAGLAPAWEQGAPLTSLVVTLGGGDRFALVARPDAAIDSPEDMTGHSIAVFLGTGSEQAFRAIAQGHGVDLSAVEIVNMQPVDMAAALVSGQVDGALAIEPQASQMEEEGTVEIVVRAHDYVGGVYGFVNFHSEFVEENPEAVRRFVRAHARAMQWVRQNPDEAIQLVQEHLPDAPDNALTGLLFDSRITPSVIDSISRDIDFLVQQGRISSRPNLDEVIDQSFIEEVVDEHPEYFDDLEN